MRAQTAEEFHDGVPSLRWQSATGGSIQDSRFKIPKNFNSTPNIQNPKIALKQNYGKQYLTPNT
jgi:hypothetical protein